jgi:hypothetical protein
VERACWVGRKRLIVALQRGRVRNRSLAAGFATFAITSGTTIFADFTIKPIEVSRSRDRVQ